MGLYDVPRTRACFVSTDRASDTLDTVARRPLFAERSDATTLTGPTGHPHEERIWVAGGKWGLPPGGLGVSPMILRLPGAEGPPEPFSAPRAPQSFIRNRAVGEVRC